MTTEVPLWGFVITWKDLALELEMNSGMATSSLGD